MDQRCADRSSVAAVYDRRINPPNTSYATVTDRRYKHCHFAFKPTLHSVSSHSPMKTEAPAYNRIVLKLSGEALQEPGARENISFQIVREIAGRIKEVHELGVQISVVIVNPGGTGNPRLLISARPAPLPPSRFFMSARPSAAPSPNR